MKVVLARAYSHVLPVNSLDERLRVPRLAMLGDGGHPLQYVAVAGGGPGEVRWRAVEAVGSGRGRPRVVADIENDGAGDALSGDVAARGGDGDVVIDRDEEAKCDRLTGGEALGAA